MGEEQGESEDLSSSSTPLLTGNIEQTNLTCPASAYLPESSGIK